MDATRIKMNTLDDNLKMQFEQIINTDIDVSVLRQNAGFTTVNHAK